MNKGFTIIELIIAIAIFSVLIVVTIIVLQTTFFNSDQQFTALNNIDNAREVTTRFTNELRNATTGVDGSYSLTTAGDSQVIFYSSYGANGTIDKINYYLSGTTLYKGITVPSGSPAAYNPANEIDTDVQNDVVNQGPIFTYYDGNYDGTTSPLSQPVNVNSVKYVEINLTILNAVKAQSQTSFNISAGAAIRDVKTNAGN